MRFRPDTDVATFVAANTQATGANGVITLAAPTDGSQHLIDWVSLSYLVAAATGNLSISGLAGDAEAATTFTVDIIAGGEHYFRFEPPLRGVVNTAVVLTAVDGSTTKKIVVGYR